jgi:hypothetical protein
MPRAAIYDEPGAAHETGMSEARKTMPWQAPYVWIGNCAYRRQDRRVDLPRRTRCGRSLDERDLLRLFPVVLTGDRGFESCFLQRRVRNEPLRGRVFRLREPFDAMLADQQVGGTPNASRR